MKKRPKNTKHSKNSKIAAAISRNAKLEERLQGKSLRISMWHLGIQIAIAIALLLAFFSTLYNINKQAEFYRNTLRPWLACELDTTGNINALSLDEAGTVRLHYRLRNYGYSPAVEVRSYSAIVSDTISRFPDSLFEEMIERDSVPEYIHIFPTQEVRKKSAQFTPVVDTSLSTETSQAMPLVFRTEKEMLQALAEVERLKLYGYVYIVYLDISENTYYLQCSYEFLFGKRETDYVQYYMGVYPKGMSHDAIK